MTKISAEQYAQLIQPINANRVQKLQGKHQYLEQWDVRRFLICIFGFDGFDVETKSLELVRELEPTKGRWTIVYRAEVRLSIKVDGEVIAVFEDAAAGDAINQPSIGDAHDLAMKTALSQALKRCAANLGDQFGLSLYGKTTNPVVRRSLIAPGGGSDASPIVETEQVQGGGYDRELVEEPSEKPQPMRRATPVAQPIAEPEPEAPGVKAEPSITDPQRKKIFATMREKGIAKDEQKTLMSEVLGYEVVSSNDLTRADAKKMIDFLDKLDDQSPAEPGHYQAN